MIFAFRSLSAQVTESDFSRLQLRKRASAIPGQCFEKFFASYYRIPIDVSLHTSAVSGILQSFGLVLGRPFFILFHVFFSIVFSLFFIDFGAHFGPILGAF